MRTRLFGLFWVVLFSSTTFASEFEYPELMVAPRASERLKMEAQTESEGKWLRFWPLQISALATFTMGLSTLSLATYSDTSPNIPIVEPNTTVSNRRATGMMGVAVGGAWLLTSIIMSAAYTPYQNGWDSVKGLPTGSKREQLTRERMAEEILADANAMAWRLTILSVVTNFGISLYATKETINGTIQPILPLASAALSLVPVLFRFKWMSVYAQHLDYKKKIYGPIASIQPGAIEMTRGTVSPGLTLAVSF